METPNQVPLGCSPVKTNIFLHFLASHPDKQFVEYLRNGFHNGFDLGCTGEPTMARTSDNFPSCLAHQSVVDEYLQNEIKAGRIWGPHDTLPLNNLQCAPMGVIPKHEKGKYRIIHHLSHPEGDSVNDFIDKDTFSLSYITVDDAIKIIQKHGKATLMAKFDLCNAFRLAPVSRSSAHLQGICWRGRYYVDLNLQMGLRSSPWIFNQVSSAIEWIGKNHDIEDLLHLLDDFFTAGPPNESVCEDNLDLMLTLCTLMGVPIKESKTVHATTCIIFLGIILDSVKQEARLPQEKLTRYKAMLHNFQVKSKVRLKQLQSLIGALNYCCRCVRGGRAFLQRLVDLTRGKKHPYHYVRLNHGAKLDIKMWQEFLEHWNGITLFPSQKWLVADAEGFSCDASGQGLAGFIGTIIFNMHGPLTCAELSWGVRGLLTLSAVGPEPPKRTYKHTMVIQNIIFM